MGIVSRFNHEYLKGRLFLALRILLRISISCLAFRGVADFSMANREAKGHENGQVSFDIRVLRAGAPVCAIESEE